MSEFRDRAWGEANNLLSYAKEADSLLTQLIAMKNATGMLHIEDADEVNMILNAVGQYQAAKFLKYVEMKDALEAGDEYGNLKSHDEKQILDGCISLMWCVLGAVQDWLEYVSGDDGIICLHSIDDEERFGYSMGYSEIVGRLFLSGTGHSGGTSTAAKCRLHGQRPNLQALGRKGNGGSLNTSTVCGRMGKSRISGRDTRLAPCGRGTEYT